MATRVSIKDDRKFITRCIAFPVVGPAEGDWKALWADLRACWADATAASNWMITRFLREDYTRKPGDAKLPPFKPPYLYPETVKLFPNLDTRTCTCLERAVFRKYRKLRFEVLWTAASILRRFRYPQPYPIHNQAWHARFINQCPCVSIPLGRGREKRVTLRLRGGPEMRRQLALFRLIVEGAKKSEAKVYLRDNKVMIGLAIRIPRPETRQAEGVLRLRTAPDRLWVAQLPNGGERFWNHDQLRRWQAAHDAFLQRISEDSKWERRIPPDRLRGINRARETRCHKYNNRIDTALHQLANEVTDLAFRLGLAGVEYDDAIKTYVAHLPWAKLVGYLQYKAEARGLSFKHSPTAARAEAVDETPGTARKE